MNQERTWRARICCPDSGDSRKGVYKEVRSRKHVKLLGHNVKLCSDHVIVGGVRAGLDGQRDDCRTGLRCCWWPGDAGVDEGL